MFGAQLGRLIRMIGRLECESIFVVVFSHFAGLSQVSFLCLDVFAVFELRAEKSASHSLL
jgi:hypothetical protein